MAKQPQFGFNAQVITQNVCDLSSKNKDIKRTGTVIIKPIKEWINRIPSASFHCSKDPNTGIFYGQPMAQNPDGSIKFKKMIIQGHRYFNLANEQDAIDFYIFQHAPFIKDSKCMAPGVQPIFYIEDAEKESDAKIKKAEVSVSLMQQILDMKETELRNFGILHGIDPMHNTPSMIRVQLLEKSNENPDMMRDRLDNKERTTLHTLLKRAIRVGAVRHTLDKGYMWKTGIPIGFNETAAVDRLMTDNDFALQVESEVKLMEKDFTAKK